MQDEALVHRAGARIGPHVAEPAGEKARTLWERHSAQWHLVRSPLRPVQEDVAFVQSEVDRLVSQTGQPRALLLGVTVELANLSWPEGSCVLAADVSEAMVREHWRPSARLHALAVRGRWEALPFCRRSFDAVLADGSFCALPDPAAIRKALRQVADVLDTRGRLVVRTFARPEVPEPPERVLADLRNGRIANVHVAKWRLAMSLHGPLSSGVVLDSVWQAFHEAEPDSHALSRRTGWPVAEIDTVDAYRGVTARYVFPTLPELRELMSAHFVEQACRFPTYELGSRCPTLTFTLK